MDMSVVHYMISKGYQIDYILSLSPAEKVLVLGSYLASLEIREDLIW